MGPSLLDPPTGLGQMGLELLRRQVLTLPSSRVTRVSPGDPQKKPEATYCATDPRSIRVCVVSGIPCALMHTRVPIPAERPFCTGGVCPSLMSLFVFMDGALKRYPVLSSLNLYLALMGQQGQPWLSPPALCPPPRHASSFPSTTLTPHQPFGS